MLIPLMIQTALASLPALLEGSGAIPALVTGELEKFDTCRIPFLNSTIEGGCQVRINDYGANSLIELYRQDVKVCPKGLFLPLFPSENMWSPAFRAIVYFVLLAYLFLGIAVASDIFMGAIEVITSQEKRIKYRDEEGNVQEKTVIIWNETVANLTLMALGSSAPEIILATFETISRLGKPFQGDGLGTGTIVGSAAYNLLIIIALSVYVIPDGESRRIKSMEVFGITALFSILAYIWIYIVLVLITPGVVELWEALVTFALFPIFVGVSYLFDIKLFANDSRFPVATFIKDAMGSTRKLVTKMVKKNHRSRSNRTPEELGNELAQEIYDKSKKSSLFYRINAIRMFKGGKRFVRKSSSVNARSQEDLNDQDVIELDTTVGAHSIVSFSAEAYEVPDSESKVSISVTRKNSLDSRLEVEYETGNASAKSGIHFGYTAGTIVFEEHVESAIIDIPILRKEGECSSNHVFKVRLINIVGNGTIETPETTVTIMNQTSRGYFEFEKSEVEIIESGGVLKLCVLRKEGSSGEARLTWTAKSDHLKLKERFKATPGLDFEGEEGILEFENGETKKSIEIGIVDDDQYEEDEKFEVQIFPDVGWEEKVAIGKQKKCLVTILDDDEIKTMVERVAAVLQLNLDRLKVSSNSWSQQFKDAMIVEGDDGEPPSKFDYLMHFVSFHWKVLFALIPPTTFFGGWFAFWTSLLFIGIVTAIVSDAATIFGCTVGLPDAVTAITFVAMGTSIPDTFASMIAAKQDEYADASVVNVTGSNSVNVFLGLGLPWTIATIYYTIKGETYIVPAGTLGYSVGVFCVIALVALAVLVIRRHPKVANGELGGPKPLKIATAIGFFALWMVYIVLSSMKSLSESKS